MGLSIKCSWLVYISPRVNYLLGHCRILELLMVNWWSIMLVPWHGVNSWWWVCCCKIVHMVSIFAECIQYNCLWFLVHLMEREEYNMIQMSPREQSETRGKKKRVKESAHFCSSSSMILRGYMCLQNFGLLLPYMQGNRICW